LLNAIGPVQAAGAEHLDAPVRDGERLLGRGQLEHRGVDQ
jgi:hypothetical protein